VLLGGASPQHGHAEHTQLQIHLLRIESQPAFREGHVRLVRRQPFRGNPCQVLIRKVIQVRIGRVRLPEQSLDSIEHGHENTFQEKPREHKPRAAYLPTHSDAVVPSPQAAMDRNSPSLDSACRLISCH